LNSVELPAGQYIGDFTARSKFYDIPKCSWWYLVVEISYAIPPRRLVPRTDQLIPSMDYPTEPRYDSPCRD